MKYLIFDLLLFQMVVMQELYTQYLSQYMQYMQTTTPVIQPEIQVSKYSTRSTCRPLP